MFSEKNKMIIFQIKETAMTKETDIACPTVTTICGGQVFEAPCTLFSLAPVLRDCINFCEDDPGTLDLDPLFFRPRGVGDQEAAAVFKVDIDNFLFDKLAISRNF